VATNWAYAVSDVLNFSRMHGNDGIKCLFRGEALMLEEMAGAFFMDDAHMAEKEFCIINRSRNSEIGSSPSPGHCMTRHSRHETILRYI
jgi:hypothetical protein